MLHMHKEFNEIEYLNANPDVAEAVMGGKFSSGLEHYELFGKKEGRELNWFGKMTRIDKALYALNKNGMGLEIGPSHNPIAPKSKGFNVHILDHASAAELKTKYQGHGVNLENIEDVDYVWSGQPLTELVGETDYYDWIIASHVIEHVPDLVFFLQQCEKLLKQGGVLSLVIPDKRYCFDYFSACSSSGNVLDAYAEKRVKPSHGQVFDHFANACKRKGNIAWSSDGQGIPDELAHTTDVAKEQFTKSVSAADYIDVHCWRFTPTSFLLIINDLNELGLINLTAVHTFDTVGCEFFVTLRRDSSKELSVDKRIDFLRKINNEIRT